MNTEELREYCLSFPGATEDIKWGDHLCFCIGEKMFCVTGADESSHTTFKVADEEFEEMCDRDGIIPAPYMARNKWVAIEKKSALSKAEWKHYIRQSYELVLAKLPKKLQAKLAE